ncbi:MAG: OPT/YSL family transporter [Phycisphaerales bacterium]|nr:OPT/YSL family transporter [Phycisphaerales bacterium]
MADQPHSSRLPENAYRELKPGETYVPMVPPNVTVPEITTRSIVFGIVMNAVFAMAATMVALKVGQGIETAIPISILAVGLSGFMLSAGRRRSSLLENINILAISTTSGIVSGGMCFTMPAIYILDLNNQLNIGSYSLFLQMALVPFLGAVLGVVFLIPFRRYFVKNMHGKLPFPEATATNEILVTGSGDSKKQAWILIYSFIVAMFYNGLTAVMRLFSDVFTTGEASLKVGEKTYTSLAVESDFFHTLTHKIKAVFAMQTGAEFVGLGFVIGLRYASIICAGSFLSWFVIIPLLAPLTLDQLHAINPAIGGVSAEAIFNGIPRNIGIGGIFTAGLLSIFKMSRVIVTALRQALGGLIKSGGGDVAHDRTDEDISYPLMLVIGALTTIAIGLYFRFSVLAGMEGATRLTIISVLIVLGVTFLFTTVSAWAIAMISVTPISGMTVTTIIITAVVLLACGLPKDSGGMLATLLVGGVVCTALSMAGTLITEFKLGYWAGASPKKIQWSAIIASALASILVTATIMLAASKQGFVKDAAHADALMAPQANVMATALQSFIGGGSIPWLTYGVGVAVVLLVELVGISGLAFALGMYLPLELNTPILVGAIVAAMIKKSTKSEVDSKARMDKAILIGSGLIAGGAIAYVLKNLASLSNWAQDQMDTTLNITKWLVDGGMKPEAVIRFGNWFGLIAFLLLCGWAYWDSCRAKPEEVGASLGSE